MTCIASMAAVKSRVRANTGLHPTRSATRLNPTVGRLGNDINEGKQRAILMKENRPRGLGQKIGIAVVLFAVIGLASLWLFDSPDGKVLREQMTGETPRAKVEAYVRAIGRSDETAALSLWELPNLQNQEQLSALTERRNQVTSELLAAKLDPAFTILHTEWWGTCCEPSVSSDSRDAGGARMRVQFLDSKGLPFAYMFDVFVRDLPYWGAAMDYPLRQWVIRDGYPEGQEPFYWRFISKTTVEFLESKSTPTP